MLYVILSGVSFLICAIFAHFGNKYLPDQLLRDAAVSLSKDPAISKDDQDVFSGLAKHLTPESRRGSIFNFLSLVFGLAGTGLILYAASFIS